MHIRVGYDIVYDCPAPTPMFLLLSIRPERFADLVTDQIIRFEPAAPTHRFLDAFGNIAERLIAPAGPIRFRADFVVADSGEPDPVVWDAVEHGIADLPDEVLPFLLPSRYCDVDKMSQLAWDLFGGAGRGWGLVQTICTYVHERIVFGYHHASATRAASEAHEERVGVCRDFAHLAITFCRAMHIPARYCTGYLGDIGVPPREPMDFSAWFEVWLGGAWRTFDARHNVPRIGRIVMARGRDAVDAAISTSFGQTGLTRFDVITEEVDEAAGPTWRPRASDQ
ncbi:MAG TPA: transglutaminase family protein, partial [Caulobacteraceae bacterium]|nr:transglutaminase family protein [Caulobacteraceae bacterium]